jgi:hypothetical protein
MSKFTCSLVLLALLGLGLMPTSASAEGRISVYFDAEGTQRGGTSPGIGSLQYLYVYGEGFDGEFVTGVQYAIDYGPDLNFIADIGLPPVYIGTSATGISMGFGQAPRLGEKFLVHIAICTWNTNCFGSTNNEIVVGPHPLFTDETPIATVFPGQDIVQAEGSRSWTCQSMELDINPASCPNPFNVKLLDWLTDAKDYRSVLPAAILGSATFDVTEIDVTTVLLEGVEPERHSYEDVAVPDGRTDCVCNDFDPDGYTDLTLKFNRHLLAAAILAGDWHDNMVGDELTLTATGALMDGTPFTLTDCITLVGNDAGAKVKLNDSEGGASGLGYPTPNPFNPVTRISYNVPTTQHVRIAIYDVAGRLVEDLVNETKGAGEYVVEWDAGNMPSGVYFYRMQTGDQTIVRRATLLK